MSTPSTVPSAPHVIRIEFAGRTLAVILLAIAAVWLSIQLWAIGLIVLVALMLVSALLPLVRALEKRGVRRPIALVILFLGMAGTVVLAALLTVPPLLSEIARAMDTAPTLQARAADHLAHFRLTARFANTIRHAQTGALFAEGGRRLLPYSERVVTGIAYAVTTLFLALYLIADLERARGFAYSLVPRPYHLRMTRVIQNLETIVGGYLRGQLITSLAMMAFVFTLLTVCRVPNAIALAVFAGLADVLPFVGGLLALAPSVLTALGRGVGIATAVFVAMVIYQEIENRIIVPRVYGRALRLPAAAVVVAIMVGGKLLGIIGALIALPIAAGLWMLVHELRVELPGDNTDTGALRDRDEAAERTYEQRSAGESPERAAEIASEIADDIRHQDAATAEDAAHVPLTPRSER